MLESMTGYGSAECVKGGVRVVAEIRSVNNRFAEISVKLPRQFAPYELESRDLIRSYFQRGKISAYLQVQLDDDLQMPLVVNSEKTRACRDLLETVRREAGLESPVTLDHMLRFSEIFDSGNKLLEQTEEIWPFVRETLVKAAGNLKKMRAQEGKELAGDFQERIDSINGTLREIRELSLGNMDAVRRKLAERITSIAGDDTAYGRERVEMELVLAADKLDITEECTRFSSHNKFFIEELLDEAGGSGRKLNFLLQEQLREANTIASKSQNADISQKIVQVKEELEKIREQIQNIE